MNKSPISLIAAGRIAFLLSASPAVAQTDVYLFGGQSNMNQGIVDGFVAEMAILDPGATLWTSRYRNPGIGLDSGWNGNTWLGDPPGTGRNNFYAGTSASDPNIGTSYSAMLTAWQNSLSSITGPYEIKGIIWVQGEQDSKESISANRYADSLDNLISRLHEDLGLTPASVPFYYTSMESNAGGFTYRTTVRAQQLAADKDSGDPLSIANANRVDASGLTYSDGIHYTTASQTELGQRIAHEVIPDVTPPAAPAGVAALGGDSLVSLDWDDNTEPDLATYSVYRRTTAGSYGGALATGLSTSDYVDSPADNGTPYFYVVTATDIYGNESAQSGEVSATPEPDVTAPAAPTGLVPTAGDASVSLDWDDNPEGDLASYSVYRRTTAGSYGAALATGVSASDYVDNTAANGTTYHYVVTAVDISSNESAVSSEVSATPVDTAPAAPTGLSATAGNATVSLDWDDNSEGDLAGYSVYRRTTAGSYGSALVTGLSTSDYTDNTALNDVTYHYVVTATDDGSNESAQSSEVEATPVFTVSVYQNDFSTAPTIENEGGNTSPWINQDIAMPTAGNAKFIDSDFNGIAHDGSEMDFSGGGTGWLLINTETWAPGDYTVTFDGRVGSGTMYWDVIGGNATAGSLGVRVWMNGSPPYIRATNGGATAGRLGQPVAGLATVSVAAGSFTDTTMASQSLNITLTDSHVGSANDYVLIGWSGASGSIDNLSIMSNPTPPAAPAGLAAIGGDGLVILDWDDNTEPDLASYSVYRTTTAGSYGSALATDLSTSDYTDITADNGTTYFYVVTATDAYGNESAQSGEVSATPQIDTTAPAAPTGLSATPGYAAVSLNWDDNVEIDVASYNVYRSTTSGSYGPALVTGLTSSDYLDNTADNGTTYYYVVTAVDSSSNESDQSSQVSATPVNTAPIYQNDFSTAPTIEDEGSNTSPWINSNIAMPAAGSAKFIDSNYRGIAHDGSEMDFTGSNTGWLLINTQTWAPGDYTVTFDGRVSSGTMYWDVFGGNGSGNLSVRLWTQKTRPTIRATSAGTASRLGQPIAGTATQEVAAGSFTDTTMASQSLNITLTDAHVGSANDYILIGWAGASGSIDNLSIASATTTPPNYADWISGYDVGGLTAFTDDFDHDNLSNGIENYFGTHPGEFSQGIVPGAVTGNTFTFTHPINDTPASDITAAYRWSKDLTSGFHADGATSGGTTVNFSQGTPAGGMVTVTATITGTLTDKLFVDIEVTQN